MQMFTELLHSSSTEAANFYVASGLYSVIALTICGVAGPKFF
jgi:hypothetical protein